MTRSIAITGAALAVYYWTLFTPPLKLFDRALDAEQARLLLDQSAAMTRGGKHHGARKALLRLHRAFPANHIYHRRLAETYRALGEYKDEARMWEMFLDHAPMPGEGCPQAGQAWQRAGGAAESLVAFRRCHALEPSNPDSIFFLAIALERAGETEEAARLYSEGLRISPDYSDLSVGLARVHLRQGDVERARRLVLNVLASRPDHVDALLVAGMASRRQGNNAEARRHLERGVALAPDYSDFHAVLGSIAEQENNFEAAARHYRRVLAGGSNPEIAHRLAVVSGATR